MGLDSKLRRYSNQGGRRMYAHVLVNLIVLPPPIILMSILRCNRLFRPPFIRQSLLAL